MKSSLKLFAVVCLGSIACVNGVRAKEILSERGEVVKIGKGKQFKVRVPEGATGSIVLHLRDTDGAATTQVPVVAERNPAGRSRSRRLF